MEIERIITSKKKRNVTSKNHTICCMHLAYYRLLCIVWMVHVYLICRPEIRALSTNTERTKNIIDTSAINRCYYIPCVCVSVCVLCVERIIRFYRYYELRGHHWFLWRWLILCMIWIWRRRGRGGKIGCKIW